MLLKSHSAKELDKVNTYLSEMCSEENYKVIKEACEGATCEEGGMPSGKLCQLRKLINISYIITFSNSSSLRFQLYEKSSWN